MQILLKILRILLISFGFGPGYLMAQDTNITFIPQGRYLVIGAFHIKSNAIGFTEYVKKMDKYEVKMAFYPIKKLYYVYTKGYKASEKGFDDASRMRKETEFIDTWFMVVKPYDMPGSKKKIATAAPIETETSPTEVVEEAPAQIVVSEDPSTKSSEPTESKWVKISSNSETPTEELTVNTVPLTYAASGKYKLYFNTFYKKNFKEIKGPVELINPRNQRIIKIEQSLELVHVADPNNGTHSLELIANIFGYKKVQHDINLDSPFNKINEEFFYFKGDTLVADFPLQRYDKGDIATMYNVFFNKDAAIMLPISKYELNSLVDMLKENDQLKIRIHGHTNGNAAGKIISLPPESKKLFTLNQEVIEKNGSAKKLSFERAEVIQRYLVSFGIATDRMEVIGWGGKKPIYDVMNKLAVKNVRVEIEILEN